MSKKRKRPAKSEFKLSPRVEGILHKAVLLADVNGNFKFSGEDLIRSTMECGLSVLPAAMLMEGVQISEFYAKYYENYNINCAALTAEQRAEKFKKDIAEYLKPGNEDNPLCKMEVDALDIIEGANEWAAALGNDVICSQHIILAILDKEDTQLYKTLRNLGVSYNVEKIIDGVFDTTVSVDTRDFTKETIIKTPFAGEISNSTITMKPKKIEKVTKKAAGVEEEDILVCLTKEERAVFETYLVDMTPLAKMGNKIIGREKEVDRVFEILIRKTKCSAALVSSPGVGKTTLIERIAQKILDKEVPEQLLGVRAYTLSAVDLTAGSRYRGDLEERIKYLCSALKKLSRKILICIDELHQIVHSGRSSDAETSTGIGDMLKPTLSDPVSPTYVIGCTTDKEWKIIEKDGALTRRFQKVEVKEPDEVMAKEIIRGIIPGYEKHHGLKYDENLVDIVFAEGRGVKGRFMPDILADLLDEAGSKARMRKLKIVTKDLIEEVGNDLRGKAKKQSIGFSEN